MIELLGLALSTFVSEDLALIAGAAMISTGRHGFWPVTIACILGIFVGDVLLYLAGRYASRAATRYIAPQRLDQASQWLTTRGAWVVFASRFMPGMRLPTYVAAGVLRGNPLRFSFYFLVAACVWTPLILSGASHGGAITIFLAIALLLAIRKMPRWEFWPIWAAYLPLLPYLLYLAIKHRSLTLFTAANPGIPTGGTIGESKSQILDQLDPAFIAPYALIPQRLVDDARLQRAQQFMDDHALTYPIVLKPDMGERGNGVAIIRDHNELAGYLGSAQQDTIIQQFVPGCEYGVFYYRHPDQSTGHIFSITDKRFPTVIGDGLRTIQQLIQADPRAGQIAATYLARLKRPASDVPLPGESVSLAEIGSHCKGAIFLDGRHLLTPALFAAIDKVSRSMPGFCFGRFDLRTPSPEHFEQGVFQIIELNGVTAEATHIYDPSVGVWQAYKTMAAQWRMAFAIGAANQSRGHQPTAMLELLRRTPRRPPLHHVSPSLLK